MSYPTFKDGLAPKITNSTRIENLSSPDTDLMLVQIEHKKDEENKRHAIKIFALIFFAGIGVAMIFVYIYHLLMPDSLRWLTPDEVAAIKDLALSIMTGVSVSLAIQFTTK